MTNKIKKFLYTLEHLIPDGCDEIPTFALYHPLLLLMTEINGSDIVIFINGRIETECKFCESLFLDPYSCRHEAKFSLSQHNFCIFFVPVYPHTFIMTVTNDGLCVPKIRIIYFKFLPLHCTYIIYHRYDHLHLIFANHHLKNLLVIMILTAHMS